MRRGLARLLGPLGCAVLLTCQPGRAQAPADAVAEAPHFMAVTGKPALVDAYVAGLRLLAMATLGQGGLSFGEQAELTEKLLMPALRAQAPQLLDQWTAIYANDLSADDMKAIEAFYATPAGQHLLAAQPQIDTSLRVTSLSWQVAALRHAIDTNIAALRARGYLQ